MKEVKTKKIFEKYGFVLTEQQVKQFLLYYEMLVETNKVMNLTAITEFDEVLVKHFLDSVIAAKYLSWTGTEKIIDVGTGAGFPGIPLKILFPELQVTLLDSLNKRVKFLNEVIDTLQLQGCQAIHVRAEDGARLSGHREQYDICVSRAVAGLRGLLELCIPFLKVEGNFVAYKSLKAEAELLEAKNAMKILKCELAQKVHFQIQEDGIEMDRCLMVFAKKEKTAKHYPRKAGTPLKQPL